MASNVEIVLKENLEHLGSIGDVVRVRRGYARNFLLPRGLAVVASRGNVRQIEHEKAIQAQRIAKLRSEQEKIVAELDSSRLTLAIELTGLPYEIRGFGPIKKRTVDRAERKRSALLAAWDASVEAAGGLSS